MSNRRQAFAKSAGGSRQKSDLGDPAKWNLGDVLQFGQTLRQFEQDLVDLKNQRVEQLKSLRELESSMLKGTFF